MTADPLQITTPVTALELLSTAIRLKNMPLITQCTENLDSQLDKTNVLTIFSALSKYESQSMEEPNDFEPSAPPIIENEEQGDFYWVQEMLERLRYNCLLEIDKNADYVLKQRQMLTLSYPDILAIAERDTLEVSSELVVYSAIYRWAITECHRRTLATHLINIKAVLRQLSYCPRYGLMTKKEFTARVVDGEKGPVRSRILEEHEWRKILFYIKEKSKNRPVEELPYKWSTPRIIGKDKPRNLSARSATRAMAHTMREQENTCDSKTRCDKFIINLLTCWTAVFD